MPGGFQFESPDGAPEPRVRAIESIDLKAGVTQPTDVTVELAPDSVCGAVASKMQPAKLLLQLDRLANLPLPHAALARSFAQPDDLRIRVGERLAERRRNGTADDDAKCNIACHVSPRSIS
ncbi:hypothetical protein SB385_13655 [Burkholderia multivorans]|uniref:hypothetical protein n=1 Tax=Burkholderia multivorans TaxID=87883 RepID=UPI002B254653|nr:hypothetical protein [Burkholderia multivorans]MEB2510770.1 hypothetical protein [Burkholderia multivorans]MEB2573059.1 hypothetical protein [Burkholderia multivorans]MEB2591674.1 hypothetical protein [Burkholderia multivorans]